MTMVNTTKIMIIKLFQVSQPIRFIQNKRKIVEIFSGSEQEAEEFSKLDATEAKDKLEHLAKEKIDLNKDSIIDENELTNHILKSFVKLDDSEVT